MSSVTSRIGSRNPASEPPTERFTRLASNTAVQFVSPLVQNLLGIVMVAALSRYLGPKGLGEYALVFAYVAIFNGVFNDFGLGSTCLREISRSPERRGAILSSAVGLQLIVSAGTYLLLLVGLLLMHYPEQVREAAAIYGLTLFATSLDLLALVFFAELRLAKLVGPALLGSLITFTLTLTGILMKASLMVLVLAAMAGIVGRYVWTVRLSLRAIGRIARPTPALWRELSGQSLPLALTSVISAIAQQAPVLALSFVSVTSVGFFNASAKIPFQLLTVPFAIRMTMFPLLSEAWIADRERFARLLNQAIVVTLLIALPMSMLGVGLAGVLMPLLFGPTFASSVAPFQYLVLVSAVLFPGIIVGEALVASSHQVASLAVGLATLPVLALLLVAWAPQGGATGVAGALLTYYTILVFITAFVAHRLLQGALKGATFVSGAVLIASGAGLAFLVERHEPFVAFPMAALTLGLFVLLHRECISDWTRPLRPRFVKAVAGSPARPRA